MDLIELSKNGSLVWPTPLNHHPAVSVFDLSQGFLWEEQIHPNTTPVLRNFLVERPGIWLFLRCYRCPQPDLFAVVGRCLGGFPRNPPMVTSFLTGSLFPAKRVRAACCPWPTDPGNICAAIWPHDLSKRPAAPDDEAKSRREQNWGAPSVVLDCVLCFPPLPMDPPASPRHRLSLLKFLSHCIFPPPHPPL